jgi:hypothetical protein
MGMLTTAVNVLEAELGEFNDQLASGSYRLQNLGPTLLSHALTPYHSDSRHVHSVPAESIPI